MHARVRHGHPWVFAGEVEELLPPEYTGQGVLLHDAKGRLLGSGIYNPRSQIVWRRYSRFERAWDADFFAAALDRALARRQPDEVRRLVWSEADGLPGLVVEQYHDLLVVQCWTAGADAQRPAIIDLLRQRLKPREIIFRDDAPTRDLEGLSRQTTTASGEPLPPEWCTIDGLDYHLDFMGGQKTGFFLDQRPQHRAVAQLAPGRRVLDAFCHLGAFGLQAAKAGAASVLSLDISSAAVAAVQRHAVRNQLAVEVIEANVFDWFTEHRDARFDLIILDPPSFARNKTALPGAVRGYKELNLRALRMLNWGGILCTYSCSQHLSRELFMEVLADAAYDAGRTVHVLQETGQPPDHPILLNFPESAYLKGAWLRAE